MVPDFYNNKNIYKFLRDKYSMVKSWSDTGKYNFKSQIMHDYNKNDIKLMNEKLNLLILKKDSSPIIILYSALIGGLITFFITYVISYLNFQISILVNTTNNLINSNKVKSKKFDQQLEISNELVGTLKEGGSEVFNYVFYIMLLTFCMLIVLSFIISGYLMYHKFKRKLLKALIEECIEEM